MLAGVGSSFFVAPICFKLSNMIFSNFVEFVKKFADPEKQEI
jgi:hypothetical protein